MKSAAFILLILCLASALPAGYKAKNIKPKSPEQFQKYMNVAGVTYAADLLLRGKDQKDYFCKELTPANLIAVRLAIFNSGSDEVILPMDTLELIAPDGKIMSPVSAELVAQAVLSNPPAFPKTKGEMPRIGVASGPSTGPRQDPANPRYDPGLDPGSPSYDPSDPRNRGQYPSGRNLPQTTVRTMSRPGVVINGGGREDLSRFEMELAKKDFSDKAHTTDPVPVSMNRDRFLYFSIEAPAEATKGYTLRLPVSKGISKEIAIKF